MQHRERERDREMEDMRRRFAEMENILAKLANTK